jgi:hypothetical protein
MVDDVIQMAEFWVAHRHFSRETERITARYWLRAPNRLPTSKSSPVPCEPGSRGHVSTTAGQENSAVQFSSAGADRSEYEPNWLGPSSLAYLEGLGQWQTFLITTPGVVVEWR